MHRPLKYPTSAMVLAAGLGQRMRPLTFKIPKPLVQVGGHALLDRALDALEKVGVKRVVVNIHHLGEQIADHLDRQRPRRPYDIIISDERAALLDSAGGVVKALPYLGGEPFFILNSDTFWQDSGISSLERLARNFDANIMDILLLTVQRNQAVFPERGDFLYDAQGKLHRSSPNKPEAVIYGGALIVHPRIFDHASISSHSLNHYFDCAITQGRLFGLPLEGNWYTLTTQESIATVERLLAQK